MVIMMMIILKCRLCDVTICAKIEQIMHIAQIVKNCTNCANFTNGTSDHRNSILRSPPPSNGRQRLAKKIFQAPRALGLVGESSGSKSGGIFFEIFLQTYFFRNNLNSVTGTVQQIQSLSILHVTSIIDVIRLI